jgi:hypothetical protein
MSLAPRRDVTRREDPTGKQSDAKSCLETRSKDFFDWRVTVEAQVIESFFARTGLGVTRP